MTWGAVLAAMRNGAAHRGQQVGRRAPQTANQTRAATSQTKQAAEEASGTEVTATQKSKEFLPDDWDFMVLDVCFSAKM